MAQLAQMMASSSAPLIQAFMMDDTDCLTVEFSGDRPAAAAVPRPLLLQAASISKVVTSVLCHQLHHNGTIDVHQPLLFDQLGPVMIDRRRGVGLPSVLDLLEHRGGATVKGFDGYDRGAVLPTLNEVIAGTGAARNDPIQLADPSGSGSYSGGGYCLLQRVLERSSGTGFTDLTAEMFTGLGITGAVMGVLPPDQHHRVASGHDADDRPIPGRWRDYPESAAAGLWCGIQDLGVLAAALLSPDSVEMRLIRARAATASTRWAGGFTLLRDAERELYFHTGESIGYRSLLALDMTARRAVALLCNSESADGLLKACLERLLTSTPATVPSALRVGGSA
ncbi:serine hydrolase domain-containing protein [Nocardia amamiensis]|uniref:serine hydrolase domain-containing protein n=1 Tax=Nocardia amamiensis TaxID=404578 RepID=UPI00083446C3|nr:serine hydrolase domain-containing protein [Nocardia amamiensis]